MEIKNIIRSVYREDTGKSIIITFYNLLYKILKSIILPITTTLNCYIHFFSFNVSDDVLFLNKHIGLLRKNRNVPKNYNSTNWGIL
jgi:hypothetical protein